MVIYFVSVTIVIAIKSIVAKLFIGMVFSRSFRWCMVIEIRFTSKAHYFIAVFNEMRTITYMAGSNV